MGVEEYNEELYEAINELIGSGDLDEKSDARGIARKVVSDGYDSLTPKQRFIYDRDIQPLLDRLAQEREANRIANSNPD